MRGDFFAGLKQLMIGFKLLMKPGIRGFVLIPLTINVALFALSIYILTHYFGSWMEQLLGWLPSWLGFIEWLLWLIFSVLVLVVVAFTFTLIANFIAAPFNGFLSEAVERHLSGQTAPPSGRNMAAEVSRALWRELAKLRYYLPRVIGLVILGFIPVINSVSPLLWALFSAWMMAIQYLDYPMDNNDVLFPAMRKRLGQQRLTTLGYGSTVLLATMIPIVNWFVMPAAVAGGTALWLSHYKRLDSTGG